MADVFPPDFSTVVGKIRALIPDIEQLHDFSGQTTVDEYLFSDAHLLTLAGLNNNSVRLAAADACEVLGTSEGFISKVIATDDLKSDGAKLMAQFLERAKQLRAQAAAEGDAADVYEDFSIIPDQQGWIAYAGYGGVNTWL